MIPTSKLLPPLTPKDRAAFNQLVADFEASQALITKYGGNSRIARKEELREKLKTAKGEELSKIGAELHTLRESYLHALRAAKNQHRALKLKYVDIFSHLLDRALSHADMLIQKATDGYAAHFKAFDLQPAGRSPIVESLMTWKKGLEFKKYGLTYYEGEAGQPEHPTKILPYAVEPAAASDELV